VAFGDMIAHQIGSGINNITLNMTIMLHWRNSLTVVTILNISIHPFQETKQGVSSIHPAIHPLPMHKMQRIKKTNKGNAHKV
jgi:hypothetical protein